MVIRENTSINGSISVIVGGVAKDIAFINANIDNTSMNINFNINVQDPVNFTANADSVKSQISDFMTNLNTKLASLGVIYTL